MDKKHPIQLKDIIVKELTLLVRDSEQSEEEVEGEFLMKVGVSEFDFESQSIAVGMIAEINPDGNASFYIKSHIIGIFYVDTKKFSVDLINKWANENAPLILLPYVRENIYTLSSRAKINVFVPLMIVPTFIVEQR